MIKKIKHRNCRKNKDIEKYIYYTPNAVADRSNANLEIKNLGTPKHGFKIRWGGMNRKNPNKRAQKFLS